MAQRESSASSPSLFPSYHIPTFYFPRLDGPFTQFLSSSASIALFPATSFLLDTPFAMCRTCSSITCCRAINRFLFPAVRPESWGCTATYCRLICAHLSSWQASSRLPSSSVKRQTFVEASSSIKKQNGIVRVTWSPPLCDSGKISCCRVSGAASEGR